jgi:hypothetical protein
MVRIALYGGKRCMEVQPSNNVELADCDASNKRQIFSVHPGAVTSAASIRDSSGNCMGWYDADIRHESDANIIMQAQSASNGCMEWRTGGGQFRVDSTHGVPLCVDVGSGGNVATGADVALRPTGESKPSG